MGEIAEMILYGTLCEQCGAYIDGKAGGYPRTCGSCEKSSVKHSRNTKKRSKCEPREKTTCSICKRRVNVSGLADHQRDSHGVKVSKP